jgi:3-oxoacyl-[acyl-carrier protein] reductase
MNRLKGKVALITGASKGFGAAIARRFGLEGASVIVNYSSSGKDAESVVSDIKAQGSDAIALRGDVTQRGEVTAMLTEGMKRYGHLDILVNNAGVYAWLPLDKVTEQHFHRLFDVNVLGTILVTQAALPHFPENGGSVINMSSIVSLYPSEGGPVYSATKGAIDALTQSNAKAYAKKAIRFNTLHPGLIGTDGVNALGEFGSAMLQRVSSATPLGRTGTVDDVAAAALFLASDESSFTTGDGLVLSGGLH